MNKHDPIKGKPFPIFYSDEEAEHFLETADLSEYDFSGFKPANFTFRDATRHGAASEQSFQFTQDRRD